MTEKINGMKKFLSLLLLAASFVTVHAQQEAMYSQYMFNGLYLNPAYAGSHDYYSSTLLFRKQWVGFSGAPQSGSFAVDGPLYGKKMGIGFIGGYDKIGVTTQTDFFLNYSYHLKLGGGKLSFGLKGGVSQYKAQLTDLIFWDQQDQIFSSDLAGKIVPKFGFGAYYYHRKFYAGISVPTTLAFDPGNNFNFDIAQSSELRRHYYVTGGYIFDLNDNWKFKPSTLIKVLPTAPVQMDLNVAFLYKDMIWLGSSFRTGDALAFIVEYQANMRFRIGYAYDMTFSKLRNYSSGTHELMIGYDFGKDFTKVKTPRFF